MCATEWYGDGNNMWKQRPFLFDLLYFGLAKIKRDSQEYPTKLHTLPSNKIHLLLNDWSALFLFPFCFIRCLDRNCSSRLNPSIDLRLEAECEGQCLFFTLFFRWKIQRLNGSEWSLPAELIRENTNRDFVIKSQIFQEHLKPGGQCIVKLETWREGGRTGYVTKILRVNEPPKPGNCSCYPPTGNISHTEFQISCDGWVDSEKPLLYSFSYRRNDNGTQPLLTSPENPSSSRKFRIYEQVSQDVLSVNISINVSVEDALGMSSWYEVKLQVQQTSRSTLKFNLLDKR